MKDTMNLIQELFFKLYKAVRGASIESGGNRELSSGFLSNGVRRSALRVSVSRPGLLLEVGCGEGIFLSQLSNERKGLLGLFLSKIAKEGRKIDFLTRGLKALP